MPLWQGNKMRVFIMNVSKHCRDKISCEVEICVEKTGFGQYFLVLNTFNSFVWRVRYAKLPEKNNWKR